MSRDAVLGKMVLRGDIEFLKFPETFPLDALFFQACNIPCVTSKLI